MWTHSRRCATGLRHLLIALLLCSARSANATAQPMRGRPALDLGLGTGIGLSTGRDERPRILISAQALLVAPVYRLNKGVVVTGVTGVGTMRLYPDLCAWHPCDDYPAIGTVALLGGWASRSDQSGGLRVMVGPTLANLTSHDGVTAATIHADLAARVTSHLALSMWTRLVVTERLSGQRLVPITGGLGLRIR